MTGRRVLVLALVVCLLALPVLPALLPTVPGLIEKMGGGDAMAIIASMLVVRTERGDDMVLIGHPGQRAAGLNRTSFGSAPCSAPSP